MTVRYYSSVAQSTTLTSSITAGATSINVASTAGFPVSFPYTLAIDYTASAEELVEVTAVAGLTLTVTRAIDGTSASSHSSGATVRHVASARDFTNSRDHENASTDVHGLAGGAAVVGTSSTQTLTNKTLTNPTINAATTTGTVATGTTTFSGTPTFSGAVTLGAGGTFTGTFTGNPTFSGNPTLSGSPVLTGTLTSTGGTLSGSFAGAHTYSGAVTLSGGGALSGTFTGTPTFSGAVVLSGSPVLTTPSITEATVVNDAVGDVALKVNAISSTTADLAKYQVNGTDKFRILPAGGITVDVTALGVASERIIYKTADETVTSSTTYQNDDHLSFSVEANAVYAVEGFILYSQNLAVGTGGVKFRFTVPASATQFGSFYGSSNNTAGSEVQYGLVADDFSGGRNLVSLGATNPSCQPRGVFIIAGTSGTVNLQWAQVTSSATGAIVKTGSYLKVTRIS